MTNVFTCLACGYIQTERHKQLRFATPCPDCGRPGTFGPGTFAADYEGVPIAQAGCERDLKVGNVPELRRKRRVT